MTEVVRPAVLEVDEDSNCVVATWTLLDEDDVGASIKVPGRTTHITAQLLGTLGSGGTIYLQGSMDDTSWGTLNDFSGTLIDLDNIGEMASTPDRPLYFRPDVNAGQAAVTSLTVKVVFWRDN